MNRREQYERCLRSIGPGDRITYSDGEDYSILVLHSISSYDHVVIRDQGSDYPYPFYYADVGSQYRITSITKANSSTK